MLWLFACGSSEPPVEVDAPGAVEASQVLNEALCEAGKHAEVGCELGITLEANVKEFVTLESNSIGMGASAQQLPGEAQIVLEVRASVDGQLLTTVEVSEAASHVDLEVAKAAVLDEAAQRFMVGYGLAILDAVSEGNGGLSTVGMKVDPQTVGDRTAYAAYPLVRGQGLDPSTAGRMGPSVASMGAALGPYVETLEPGGLHTVRVVAELGGSDGPGPCGIVPPVAMTDGATVSIVPLSGQVYVDGEPTLTICELSEAVSWPLPPAGSRLEWEQFIVLR